MVSMSDSLLVFKRAVALVTTLKVVMRMAAAQNSATIRVTPYLRLHTTLHTKFCQERICEGKVLFLIVQFVRSK